MLAPDQRALFVEALRPPEDYHFDRGIGTTFTLDLRTLLFAPLSLALLDVEDIEAALQEPALLLEGIRRYADRLAIFCQAGRIAIPPKDSYLFRFLEQMVIEVQAPGGGVFHPKLWLLRYEADEDGEPPLYRLLNLSRNLTFDRSWDLMLRLEGYVATHRKRAYHRNHPLGNFVQRLPELALRPPNPNIVEHVDLLQDEVRRVAFQTPRPFEGEAGFYPSGIPGYRPYRFRGRCDRGVVISPFLADRMLRRLTKQGQGHILISRADSIAALKPATRACFEKAYVLHELGTGEEETDPVQDLGQEVAGARSEPSGLHAKLFVREAGWDATWLVGSANATNAAFSRHNVEFMIELRGKKSKIGIDKILGEEEENSFLSLLQACPLQETVDETDKESLQAEKLAHEVRDRLLALDMHLEAEERDGQVYDLFLRSTPGDAAAPRGEFSILCWPVGLPAERCQPCTPSSPSVTFTEVSMLSLTSFLAFEVVARVGAHDHTLRFARNLPISGLPQDRKDHIYCAILSDRTRFLRYLRMLLAERVDDPSQWLDALGTETSGKWQTWSTGEETALLGALVRSLSRSPAKIKHISEVVQALRRTSQGQAVLSEDFQLLWDVVLDAKGNLE